MSNQVLILKAVTEDGFSDPSFLSSNQQPSVLLDAGMKPEMWLNFISEANESVKYQWCPNCLFWSFICFVPFFCNQHNKNVRAPMENFCQKWNPLLKDIGLQVQYKMTTQKILVRAPGGNGQGAQLETTHNLIFVKC